METPTILTPGQVAAAVEDIRRDEWDSEAAHNQEDVLYRDLLRAIAEGRCSDPAQCARIAVQTQAMKFERWCA